MHITIITYISKTIRDLHRGSKSTDPGSLFTYTRTDSSHAAFESDATHDLVYGVKNRGPSFLS